MEDDKSLNPYIRYMQDHIEEERMLGKLIPDKPYDVIVHVNPLIKDDNIVLRVGAVIALLEDLHPNAYVKFSGEQIIEIFKTEDQEFDIQPPQKTIFEKGMSRNSNRFCKICAKILNVRDSYPLVEQTI